MGTVIEFPLDETNGLEMRLAHWDATPGCHAVRFPNQDFLPAFVEPRAFIRGNEFVSVRLTSEEGRPSIELVLRPSAANRIDAMARRGSDSGLGVFRHGVPVSLIQTVHGIDGGVMAWYGFETEGEARAMLYQFGALAAGDESEQGRAQ